MDRRISVLMPEEVWRELDPNNKSADARALLKDGIEYRKIKQNLVRQALSVNNVDGLAGIRTFHLEELYCQTTLQGVVV